MTLREILENKVTELRDQIEASQDVAEVRELGETLRSVQEELRTLEDATVEERAEEPTVEPVEVPATAVLRNGFINTNGGNETMEYRNAFMELVLRGTPIPAELREDANTLTSDVATAIPKELVNRIVEKMDDCGMILPLVTRTYYKAGVVIPTSTAKPVASWVSEGAGSDTQKKTTGQVTFTYHKLRCEISMSMEVGTMALSSFEATFTDNVAKAMVKAIENAVINGDGSGKPKGVLAETPVTGQSFTDTSYNYAKLVAVESALPEEYEAGAVWCMSKKTFGHILAMVDDNGQPIARVNYGIGGKPERTILGRDVVIAPYVAEHTAFMFDFNDYLLNTVYDMGITQRQDWDTEDIQKKAVMSVDGKVVDKNSLVKLVVTITG